MKMKTLVLAIFLVMPYQLVSADVQGDLAAGLPMATIVQNALDAGQEIEDITSTVASLSPERAAEAVSEGIARFPDSAAGIVSAATAAAPLQQTTIADAAITAGADPTVVTTASAAGAAGAIQTPGQQIAQQPGPPPPRPPSRPPGPPPVPVNPQQGGTAGSPI